MGINPYKNKPQYCFWNKAVSDRVPQDLDPLVEHSDLIGPNDLVSTMGSCFAQHIARHLQKSGLKYYVAEMAPNGFSPEEALRNNYGVFSARYGNVYTVRQALQLFDRAFGIFKPHETVWEKGSVFVDPFRPSINPDGFKTPEEVIQSSEEHLSKVRDIFLKSNVIVFTLGLTEAWRSKIDGAVFPIAPGVSGGVFNENNYEPVNFSIFEVIEDLKMLISKVKKVNFGVKFLLTVSPVPLIATHENKHVLVATTYSKSVLRVAVSEMLKSFPAFVEYFPSYEVITSNSNRGSYFENDLRSVTDEGVSHVMRLFSKHYLEGAKSSDVIVGSSEAGVVCDEELIERSLKDAGLK